MPMPMRCYEIPTPSLETTVGYRALTPEETEELTTMALELSRDEYVRAVLERVVVNLRGNVSVALRRLPDEERRHALDAVFYGALMLNPALDVDAWLTLSNMPGVQAAFDEFEDEADAEIPKPKRLTRPRLSRVEQRLRSKVIGQAQAVDEVMALLRRSLAGLCDEGRPLGSFLFAGASRVGKTFLARELSKALFDSEPVRVDCGEYQHKHENQKLIGSPPGYIGHDEGGQLSNAMAENPQRVVLFDEVDKAHPDLFDTLLRVVDEGVLTDGQGVEIDFTQAIVIFTTNLGNPEAVERMLARGVGFGSKGADRAAVPPRATVVRDTLEAVRSWFRPEFLNRLDEVIVFNHLDAESIAKIAELELDMVESKLSRRGFRLTYDDAVVAAMVKDGTDSIEGVARLSKIRRVRIERPLSELLLARRHPRGTAFQVTWDGEYRVHANTPKGKTAQA